MGQYNLTPSLSPDGSQMMFFSNRDLFSIDLYLADARTGKVKRQVTKTALDPHLESLQFIQSAGSWSPDGRRFVFAGVSGGRPDLEHLRRRAWPHRARDHASPSWATSCNPSWSPDGRAIAFSALVGGLSDLFVYDLETKALNRLTKDSYSDLQPSWSPDGRTIAFVTDRFTTRLDDLAIGPYTLALFDRGTGRVTRVPGFEAAKHLNPQWTPDGSSLYFVADPGGIPDIYRVRLADGELRQVTNLFTGVSGITETSPAFSVALRSGRLAYSVFRTNGYRAVRHGFGRRPRRPAGGPACGAGGRAPAAGRTRERYAGERPERSRHGPAWRHDVRGAAVPARIRPHRRGTAGVGGGDGEFGTYVGGGAVAVFHRRAGQSEPRHRPPGERWIQGHQRDRGLCRTWRIGSTGAPSIQQVPYLTGSSRPA